MKRKLFSVAFSIQIALTSFVPVLVFAQTDKEFSSNYDITYTINGEGKASVVQKVTVENLTSSKYIKSYQLILSSDKIEKISASDRKGALKLNVTKKDGKTLVEANFNDQVAGKGEKLVWQLQYQNPDTAVKTGSVWQIDIPGIADTNAVAYKLTLSIPSSFGQVAFISPQPKTTSSRFGQLRYTFDQNKFITATFGRYQAFSFDLKYHLKNPQLSSIFTEIALPPQTSFQDVFIDKIEPPPTDVRVDDDGNWLAKFSLGAKETVDITVKGVAKLYPAAKDQPKALDESKKALYLLSQPFWQTDHPDIVKKAKELGSPDKIYQFVATTLQYNTERINSQTLARMGAAAALEKPDQAVCMEFTDLFVALARAAGIPAREINGYAYTPDSKLRPLSLGIQGSDILHAWPEYWDQQRGWIAVDPTWGSTTQGADYFNQLDLNHFALAIHGLSSTQPFSAGSYKYDVTQNNDVTITFTEDLPKPQPRADISFIFSDKVYAGLPLFAHLTVKNTGNSLIESGDLQIYSDIIKLKQDRYDLGPLPPGANRKLRLDMSVENWLFSGSDTLKIELNNGEYQTLRHVTIKPIYADSLPFLGGSVVVIAAITATGYFIAKKTRGVSISREPGASDLRGQSHQSEKQS